jgi:hypothetical protein
MDIEWYRQQLLALEQELEEKIAREVEEARDTGDDQWEALTKPRSRS